MEKRKYEKLSGSQRKKLKKNQEKEDFLQSRSLLKFLKNVPVGQEESPSCTEIVHFDILNPISSSSRTSQDESSKANEGSQTEENRRGLSDEGEPSTIRESSRNDCASTVTFSEDLSTNRSLHSLAVIFSEESSTIGSLHSSANPELASTEHVISNPMHSNSVTPIENHSSISDFQSVNLKCDWPSDPQHFYGRIVFEMSFDEKKILLKIGPCQPSNEKIKFPKTNHKHNKRCSFTTALYKKFNKKTNKSTPRTWIHYSVSKDAVFCFSCWLFANPSDRFYDAAFSQTGVKKWSKIYDKVIKHENSNLHRQSMITWKSVSADAVIDKDLQIQINREISQWKEVVKRLIDIILLLSKQNLAFRGSHERLDNPSCGNFLALVNFLAKYDFVLQAHINKKNHIKYLSNTIQNELIELLSNEVRQTIIKWIKTSKHFAIMVDTTTDLFHVDQLSFVIRYIRTDDEKVQITESFLGFIEVPGDKTKAADFTEMIISYLKEIRLNIKDCRGQSYDGAAVMKGKYTGLQKRLKDINPLAVYVHCASHTLNLVIADSSKVSTETITFFAVIQKVYTFFSSSNRRWTLITRNVDPSLDFEEVNNGDPTESKIGTEYEDISQNIMQPSSSASIGTKPIRVKQVCITRWEGRLAPVVALRKGLPRIIEVLNQIKSASHDGIEICECQSLLTQLTSFSFILMIIIWENVLTLLNKSSKYMQSKSCNVLVASDLLRATVHGIEKLRKEGFAEALIEAKELATLLKIEPLFPDVRKKKKKMMPGELTRDEPIDDPEKSFEIHVYNTMMDAILTSLNERFQSMMKISETFHFLYPSHLVKMSKSELQTSCDLLISKYDDDLDAELFSEMISMQQILMECSTSSLTNPAEVPSIIIKRGLQEVFLNVLTAYNLMLTIPISIASCERSFSKLKLIKNYLRSTMSQSRLTGLSLLSIESATAKNINFDSIIEKFATLKARRIH